MLLFSLATAFSDLPSLVGSTKFKKPAFLKVIENPITGTSDLFISSFGFLAPDTVSYVRDFGSQLSAVKELTAQKISGTPVWPNEVTKAPAALFGQEGLLVAGGFLVPGKGNGGIWISLFTESGMAPFVELFRSKKGFFYHRVLPFDVNNDGHLDLLTCKAKKGMFGSDGSLVMLEPVDRANPLGEWFETELFKHHCDVFMEIADFDQDGKRQIITTDFFTTKSVNVFYSTSPTDDFTEDIQRVLIDEAIGAPFDIHLADINNDGIVDLLVTNHQPGNGNPRPAVYAYEVTKEWKQGRFTRHMLASGFPVTQFGMNQASPGAAQAFYPYTEDRSRKPFIVVAGDGAQRAYILKPSHEDPTNWSYEVSQLHKCNGAVVGGIAIGDVDRDGYTEIMIPCYDEDVVHTFTYRPE